MGESVKLMFERSIQLASSVLKTTDEATVFKQECEKLKLRTRELARLLHRFSSENIEYDHPFLIVMTNVEEVLLKALSLVEKCATSNRLLRLVGSSGFPKILPDLDNCIGDVKWLIDVLQTEYGGRIFPVPPIATNNPFIARIWSSLTTLYHSSPDTRGVAALESLAAVALENNEHKKLIIQAGGVVPLLKALKHCAMEDQQEHAAKIFGYLGYDRESVEHIIDAGAFPVFAKILKDGPMKVQTAVALAVYNLTEVHPRCQDICVQNNIVRLLINHLSFEMIQDHTQNFIPINKATSVLAFVRASGQSNKNETAKHWHSNESFKNKQLEDPKTKSLMKLAAARALWQLVKGNITICQIIVESRAFMCFITLLTEGSDEDVQYASIMAIMEIAAIAEQDADLRRSTFRPSSALWKAVIDILGRIIQRGTDSRHLLIPSVKAIGNLARTFQATSPTIISSLVKLISSSEPEIAVEVLNALEKFCNLENHLRLDNCKAIISLEVVLKIKLTIIAHSARLKLLMDTKRDVPGDKEGFDRVHKSALIFLKVIACNVPGNKEVEAGLNSLLRLRRNLPPW